MTANDNNKSDKDPLPDAEPKGQSEHRGQCIICGQNTVRKCTMCSIRLICGKTCQERATIDGLDAEHFKLCVDQPRTTADILFKSIINNQVPTDRKTLSDYRFDTCFNDYDKRQLVSAYSSVLVYNYVSTREMDIWMKDEIIFERMGTLLCVYPDTTTLDILKWFYECAWEKHGIEMSCKVRRLLLLTIARKEGDLL